MNTDKEIKKLERKLELLRAKALRSDSKRKKTALGKVIAVVKKYGFASIHELLEIADTAAIATASKRKRAKIDDGTRKSVTAMLKSGETVAETARKHKISVPSVNLIKKAGGLTKSRKATKKSPSAKKSKKVPPSIEGSAATRTGMSVVV
jgi:hypothetical protein